MPPNAKLFDIRWSMSRDARRADNVVEFGAPLVDDVEIHGRHEAFRAHHLDAEPGLDGAASAQRCGRNSS